MQKENPKPIRLARETLRLLEQAAVLKQAVGGGILGNTRHVTYCAGKC